jgi:hypothetical protein
MNREEMVSLYEDYYGKRKKNKTTINDSDALIIAGMACGTKSKSILDYGCGHGLQYKRDGLHKKMRIDLRNVFLYDIGNPRHNVLIDHNVDGVICTDVLEHIPEEFLDEALTNIFTKADKFVYLTIHCGLAKKVLSNGQNAHCTIKHPREWKRLIKEYNTKELPVYVKFNIPTNPAMNPLNI